MDIFLLVPHGEEGQLFQVYSKATKNEDATTIHYMKFGVFCVCGLFAVRILMPNTMCIPEDIGG